ncbi:hypothetical protein, partial [Marinobacter alexandrii]|uniref:hypothetical protein n=1 Tax=Marinobacter alexandrii TaxID=2570351 RepID=UPI00326372A6
ILIKGEGIVKGEAWPIKVISARASRLKQRAILIGKSVRQPLRCGESKNALKAQPSSKFGLLDVRQKGAA